MSIGRAGLFDSLSVLVTHDTHDRGAPEGAWTHSTDGASGSDSCRAGCAANAYAPPPQASPGVCGVCGVQPPDCGSHPGCAPVHETVLKRDLKREGKHTGLPMPLAPAAPAASSSLGRAAGRRGGGAVRCRAKGSEHRAASRALSNTRTCNADEQARRRLQTRHQTRQGERLGGWGRAVASAASAGQPCAPRARAAASENGLRGRAPPGARAARRRRPRRRCRAGRRRRAGAGARARPSTAARWPAAAPTRPRR